MSRIETYNIEEARRAQEQHQKERQVLFENETLAVKVLQAVSGASMIAALAQADTLIRIAGRTSLLIFLTATAAALLAAVFAIHWKHQYKLWDVKAAAASEKAEAQRRLKLSGVYLSSMRAAMWVSLILIAIGFVQLLAALWIVGWRAADVALAV